MNCISHPPWVDKYECGTKTSLLQRLFCFFRGVCSPSRVAREKKLSLLVQSSPLSLAGASSTVDRICLSIKTNVGFCLTYFTHSSLCAIARQSDNNSNHYHCESALEVLLEMLLPSIPSFLFRRSLCRSLIKLNE